MAKLFMYQGESDTGKVTNWRGMFLKLIVDLKADTGVNFHTYIFQIGANPRPDVYIYWRSIQQQQHHVSLDTGWPMVMTANIPLCPPTSPHHCAAGYQEITARMMALIP